MPNLLQVIIWLEILSADTENTLCMIFEHIFMLNLKISQQIKSSLTVKSGESVKPPYSHGKIFEKN